MKYRLYIDEVGNPDMGASENPNHRYLSLPGVIAHPSFKRALARQNQEPLPQNFGGHIAQILWQDKYDRSPGGRIDGWGLKWLP